MARVIGLFAADIQTDIGRHFSFGLSPDGSAAVPHRLRKAVEVVHMYPVTGHYSHYCRRVFNALLAITTKAWQAIPPELQSKVLDERRVLRFGATVGEIGRVLQNATKATERIYAAVETLYGQEFRFDAMGERGDTHKVASRLIAQYSRGSNGTGEVHWEFLPDVFEMLMTPGRWAAIDIHLANRFNSGYSLALYENTYRYISVLRTARLPVVDWVKLLVSPSSAESFLEQGNYRYFKRDILVPAMRELENTAACPYTVELVETAGARRKVTHIQFLLHPKDQPKASAVDANEVASPGSKQMTGPQAAAPQLQVKLREYGLAEKAVAQLLAKYEEPELRGHIQVFDQRLADGNIRDTPAAFMHQVKNNYGLNGKPAVESSAPVPALAAGQAAEAKRLEDGEEFRRHLAQRVRKYFQTQPRFVQDQLVRAFLQDAGTTNLVREHHEKKGFDSPMVSGTFYAWLGKQDGVLARAEDASVEAFVQWRDDRRSARSNTDQQAQLQLEALPGG